MEINIPQNILWALFLILFIIFAISGGVFSYHWNQYGMNKKSRRIAKITYFSISSLILFGIFIFIFFYNF